MHSGAAASVPPLPRRATWPRDARRARGGGGGAAWRGRHCAARRSDAAPVATLPTMHRAPQRSRAREGSTSPRRYRHCRGPGRDLGRVCRGAARVPLPVPFEHLRARHTSRKVLAASLSSQRVLGAGFYLGTNVLSGAHPAREGRRVEKARHAGERLIAEQCSFASLRTKA